MIFYIILGLIGIVFILLIVVSLLKKKNERLHNIEAIDNPKVVKGFERMAKTPPFKLIRKAITSKIEELNPQGTIVDVGCGSGNLLIKLAKKFPKHEIIGVDLSDEMLEAAKKRIEKKGNPSEIKCTHGSANDLPFDENSVDYIISSLSLHHWVNPLVALQEMYRVLKNNGYLVIFDFRRNSRNFFYGLLKFATKIVVPRALKEINEPLGSLLSSYTETEIEEIFAQSPFQEYNREGVMAWMFIIAKKG
jgi:ubiquinone/menaquinone biosynthesis C-methylase UbiE